MAKDSFWFKHDANARNDMRVIDLRAKHGFEGYGIYFAILEVMREQDGYRLPVSKRGHLSIALGDGAQLISSVLDSCIECGLFESDGEYIYSTSFIKRMANWEQKKQNGSTGGRPPKADKNQPDNRNDNLNDIQGDKLIKTIREEKSRKDEKRQEENSLDLPTIELCIEVAKISGFTPKQGEAYYHFRSKDDWMVARGNSGNLFPIKNWRSDLVHCVGKGYLDRELQKDKSGAYLQPTPALPYHKEFT
jgi:hypothetical protein